MWSLLFVLSHFTLMNGKPELGNNLCVHMHKSSNMQHLSKVLTLLTLLNATLGAKPDRTLLKTKA